MKTHIFRLVEGVDLKLFLSDFIKENKISSGCILCSVGSLKHLNIRLADENNILTKDQKYEILSLNGTLSQDGIHLHISVADSVGNAFGGHLLDGNIVYTTVELIIAEIENRKFKRAFDRQTGFNELVIE